MAIKYQWQYEEEQKRIAQREFDYWRGVAMANHNLTDDSRFALKQLPAGMVDEAKRKQMVTVGRFTFILQITLIPRRSDGANWGDSAARHYQVTIACEMDSGQDEYTAEYSQGSGIPGWPRARRILESVVSDAQAGLYDFEEFCDNFGFDNDSRSAERMHDQCRKAARVFNRWGLNDDDITDLYQQLGQE